MTYTFVNIKVKQAGLTVTVTDATNEHFPTKNSPGAADEDGKRFYYRPVGKRETKLHHYRTKLGAALARELKKANRNIVIPNDALTDLPEGYQLFEHVKNYDNDPKKYRTDTYLFGFGSIKFRSPAEFENHLLWLASDQSTNCLCKYCKESTSKKVQSISQEQKSSIQSSSSSTTPNQVGLRSKSKRVQASNNVQHPSNIKHYIRNGEIVWIKASLILSKNYLEELRKGNVNIEYWPGCVFEQQKFSQIVNNVASVDIRYRVRPFNVERTQTVLEEQVIPWLLLSESLIGKDHRMRNNYTANQGTYSSSLMHVINLFYSACDTAKKIIKSSFPLDPYMYTLPPLSLLKIKDSNERQLLMEIEKCAHYRTLCFGSEILKVDDYVKMNDAESKGNHIKIFKINTIYKNSNNKTLLNGDIYLKSFNKGKICWSRLNDEDREYFIELKEISGRYYDNRYESMKVNEAISFNEKKKLMERQEMNKPKPSPSVGKKMAKRPMYFDNSPNPLSKKLKVQSENTTPQEIEKHTTKY